MRFYSRKELAEILSVNINDSKHFADNVKAKLRKWGYGFEYVRAKGAVITSIPTTAEERLAEIMIRQYDLDVQISPYAFSCFVTAFSDIEGFDSMPWGERAKAYYSYSGILVDERTLRNWCSRLMRQGAVSKADEVTYWKTEFIHGIKVRSQVQREETLAYYARRSEIVQEEMEQNLSLGMSKKEAAKDAWAQAYGILWNELHCCYYSCRTFMFSAFSHDEQLLEVYELTRLISGKEERTL